MEVSCSFVSELKPDQSLSHNGVCLTVTKVDRQTYRVTVVEETLKRSALGTLVPGSLVNLERAIPATGRFDGHFVQGHVDVVGKCISIEPRDGSWLVEFSYPEGNFPVVDKGSIAINGVSLTCFNVRDNRFSVAIIPYTYEHTTFKSLQAGDPVNLEFDMIGKYVQKMLSNTGKL